MIFYRTRRQNRGHYLGRFRHERRIRTVLPAHPIRPDRFTVPLKNFQNLISAHLHGLMTLMDASGHNAGRYHNGGVLYE